MAGMHYVGKGRAQAHPHNKGYCAKLDVRVNRSDRSASILSIGGHADNPPTDIERREIVVEESAARVAVDKGVFVNGLSGDIIPDVRQ